MKSRFVSIAAVLLAGSLLITGCSAAPAAVSSPTPTTCDPSPEFPISAYDFWLQDGHTGTVTDFLNSLVGTKGATGYVGYGGPGKAGIAGATGDTGASAYQLWLDAGNAGSVDEFVASLTGASGTNGTDGTNGTNGTNGTDGLNGVGAYELWLELGNTGTKADFLASLQGVCTAGANGEQGIQGAQGVQGIQGLTGATGAQGPTGATGSPGAAGAQGPAGPAGVGTPVEVAYTLGGGTTGSGAQQPTFNGNPMFYGSYVQLGDMVFFNVRVVMTNITNFGRGQYYVTIPFASKYSFSTSNGRVRDAGATRDYVLYGFAAAGSSTLLLTTQGSGQQIPFDYNTPVTLAPTDVFMISGSYIKQ